MDAKAVAAAKGGLIGKAMEGAGSGLGSKVAEASMRALQTVTTGTVNSAINAVTYSAAEEGGGWGYNTQGFAAGVQSAMVSAGAGIVRGVTEGLLQSLNSATVNTHAGFSDTNKINAGDFASFVGNAAGEAVNYAYTGTFSMNVLNLGFLAGKEDSALNRLLSTGLMELHLGKDGATMNIGTGGMDASVGTVANALKGAAVLGADGLALLYEAAAKWKDLNESETDMMKARAELAERMYGFGGNEENGLALKDALVSVLSGWKAFAFGTNEDRAGVLATAIGIAMLDEEEFRGAMSILNEWKSLLDPGSFSVPFNASDTEMPKTTSVSDTIENNAGKIGDTVDKLNFPPWAIEFIGDSMDVINWLESGDHFTFMEGLYLAYRGVLDIKIATGNMINSFPSAGIYGRNLFEGGDRYSVTVGLGNGTPVWNGLDQFGNYRASLNYLSDSRFAMTMSLCGNMFAANLFSKFILGLKWWM